MTAMMPRVHPTVLHMLAEAAKAVPDRPAVCCGASSITYRELLSCVAGFAAELGPDIHGGRVAVIMANSIDIAVAIYAVGAMGAQVVPLNPAYTVYELEPILADADPAIIICDEALSTAITDIASRIGIGRVIAVGTSKSLTAWRNAGLSLSAYPDPASLSILQYTGGTTGRSKGVNLTHAAVSTNIAQREALLPSEDGERVLAITPLYHSYAMAMGLYLSAYCRATLYTVRRYHPQDVLDTIAREKITLFAGSPTLFVGLMGHEAFCNTDFSSLKLCFSGASALPAETLRRWEESTGCVICEGYGQTEAGPVLTYNPRYGVRKAGSVGLPLPETEVQVVDTETGTIVLPTGEAGEIRARGPQIMAGYRNRPEETAAALRDGWLYTGDIGIFDDDGYLFIQDRKKDMVIVGGFNVYPREVEEALCRHPEVIEAAVIGVPDGYRGEALRAYVVLKPNALATPESLSKHLEERLTKYKLPRSIEAASALPKTSVGKIDKQVLRRLATNTDAR